MYYEGISMNNRNYKPHCVSLSHYSHHHVDQFKLSFKVVRKSLPDRLNGKTDIF